MVHFVWGTSSILRPSFCKDPCCCVHKGDLEALRYHPKISKVRISQGPNHLSFVIDVDHVRIGCQSDQKIFQNQTGNQADQCQQRHPRILVAIDQVLWYVDLLGFTSAMVWFCPSSMCFPGINLRDCLWCDVHVPTNVWFPCVLQFLHDQCTNVISIYVTYGNRFIHQWDLLRTCQNLSCGRVLTNYSRICELTTSYTSKSCDSSWVWDLLCAALLGFLLLGKLPVKVVGYLLWPSTPPLDRKLGETAWPNGIFIPVVEVDAWCLLF